MTVCVACIPFYTTSDSTSSLVSIVVLTSFIGFFSAIVYGSFYQIASIISSGGRLQASFAMGYQGSGAVALIISLAIGFKSDARDAEVRTYFFTVAGVEIMSLVSFLILMCGRKNSTVPLSLKRKESTSVTSPLEDGTLDAPLLENAAVTPSSLEERSLRDDGVSDGDRATTPNDDCCELSGRVLSYQEICAYTWPALLSLFLTVFGALCILPFYTYIPSSRGNENFSQLLFYVKLGADMIGRPCTVLLRVIHSKRGMVIASLIRVCFLPFFFLYTFGGDVIPKNDVVAAIGIGVFSFSSGFINTVAYQLAPTMIPVETQTTNGARVANVINTAFHAAVYGGLLISVVVYASSGRS